MKILPLAKVGVAVGVGLVLADRFLIDYGNGKGLVKAEAGFGADDGMRILASVAVFFVLDLFI